MNSEIGRICGKDWIRQKIKDNEFLDAKIKDENELGTVGEHDEKAKLVIVDFSAGGDESTKVHEMGHIVFPIEKVHPYMKEMLSVLFEYRVFGPEVFKELPIDYRTMGYVGIKIEDCVGAEFFWNSLKKRGNFKEIEKKFHETYKGNLNFPDFNNLFTISSADLLEKYDSLFKIPSEFDKADVNPTKTLNNPNR